MTTLIETGHDGPVTTISLNRPEKRNALNREMLGELLEALRGAHERPETRVIVIAGNGDAFCAGADLNEYAELSPLEARSANIETWMRVFSTIETIDEPVIASVHGFAVAGGTELTLACDLVVAAEDATLGLVEAQVGVIPGAGACVRLPRWVGRAAAKELLMTGATIDGLEAHRLGLVNRAVPADALASETAELAGTLASRSPLALAAVKRVVNVGGEMDLDQGIAYALQEFALLFAGDDQREGMQAFLERRTPEFKGR